MSQERRKAVADQLRELADRIERDENMNVAIESSGGCDTQYRLGECTPHRMDYNGTETIAIKINGGARDNSFVDA